MVKQIGEYTFQCEIYGDRSNWGHECSLTKDGKALGKHRVRYYNRTWEEYPYKTCMKQLAEKLGLVEVNEKL